MTAQKKCRRVGVQHCEWCTTGAYKRIARRKDRHDTKTSLRSSAGSKFF